MKALAPDAVRARRLAAAVILAAGALMLAGCASISPRVWQNGRYLDSYQMLYGPHDQQQMRTLHIDADPTSHFNAGPRRLGVH